MSRHDTERSFRRPVRVSTLPSRLSSIDDTPNSPVTISRYGPHTLSRRPERQFDRTQTNRDDDLVAELQRMREDISLMQRASAQSRSRERSRRRQPSGNDRPTAYESDSSSSNEADFSGRLNSENLPPPRPTYGSAADFIYSPEYKSMMNSPLIANYDRVPSTRMATDGDSRHRSRSKRHNYEEPEYSAAVDDETYTYSVSRRSRSRFSVESTLASTVTAESNEKLSESRSMPEGSFALKPEIFYNVMKSHYTGSGYNGDLQTAELKVFQEDRKNKSAVYRWVHFPNPGMVFEDFRKAVLHIPDLTASERSGISKLLDDVKRKFSSRLQTSSKKDLRAMTPAYREEQLTGSQAPNDKFRRPRKAVWICLPYFSLEKRVEDTSELKGGSHPVQTLLQARYSTTTKAEDLEQAVCALSDVEQGSCFHIAQTWFLIVDDSLLVTNSRMPFSTLCKGAISYDIIPKPDGPKSEQNKLLVAHGEAIIWEFPVVECQTWFAFISKFSQFWPHYGFHIAYNGESITAEQWPRIINRAQHIDCLRLKLQLMAKYPKQLRGVLRKEIKALQTGELTNPMSTAVQVVDPATRSTNTKGESATQSSQTSHSTFENQFHAFNWLSTRDNDDHTRSMPFDEKTLKSDLQGAHAYLMSKVDANERFAYRSCPMSSHQAVLSTMEQEVKKLSTAAQQKETQQIKDNRQAQEVKIDVLNAAETVFEFFLPLEIALPTTQKVWGALNKVLDIADEQSDHDQEQLIRRNSRAKDGENKQAELFALRVIFDEIVTIIGPCRDILSHATPEERSRIDIPDEFMTAWLHLVMGLVLVAQDSGYWHDQLELCATRLREGTKILMRSLVRKSLLEYMVAMPQEIALMLHNQLSHDVSSTSNHKDISLVYSKYFSRLKKVVEDRPLERGHQDKLVRLRREISVIREYLEWQHTILTALALGKEQNEGLVMADYHVPADRHRSSSKYVTGSRTQSRTQRETKETVLKTMVNRDYIQVIIDEDDSKAGVSPTNPDGYRALLIQLSLEFVDARLREFKQVHDQASILEEWIIRNIDTSKDRQEKAIYAFTVVTIIFLPLSTVAGILGMNTNDVRNMEVNQWVFWVIAIPLTGIILFLCLLWTGELTRFLENLLLSLMKRSDRRRTSRRGKVALGRRSASRSRSRSWSRTSSPSYYGSDYDDRRDRSRYRSRRTYYDGYD